MIQIPQRVLFGPGPSDVPARVLEALGIRTESQDRAEPQRVWVSHRSPPRSREHGVLDRRIVTICTRMSNARERPFRDAVGTR